MKRQRLRSHHILQVQVMLSIMETFRMEELQLTAIRTSPGGLKLVVQAISDRSI